MIVNVNRWLARTAPFGVPAQTVILVAAALTFHLIANAICPVAAFAEKGRAVREANWTLARQWDPLTTYHRLGSTSVRPNWIEDSELFWYRYVTRTGRRYWLVDPEGRTKEPLFDRCNLAAEIARLTEEATDSTDLDLAKLTVEPDGSRFQFEFGGLKYSYDRVVDVLARTDSPVSEEGAEEPHWTPSPDGAVGAFTRGHDLFVCDLRDPAASEVRISTDGVRGLNWGATETLIDDDDIAPRPAPVVWSPDSRRFYIARADFREVGELWLVEHLSDPRPTLRTFPYPMVGESTPQNSLWLYERAARSLVEIDVARWPDQILEDLLMTSLWWSEDSRILYLARRSRDHTMVDLCAFDTEDRRLRTVIEERMPGQVYMKDLEQLPGRGELLWWSMRDGWGHLFRYTASGTLKNQVTTGDYNVDRVVRADREAGVVYFLANGREDGRNPYYRHLYRVRLDGTDLRLLTREDAEHEVEMSPSGRWIVDNLSRVDMPTRAVLRDVEGNELLELETADISELLEAGWQAPEIFTALSADGVTEQWGVLYKPFDFDPARKYPIVTRVYPGRFNEFIPRSFWPVHAETFLAQLGCIVVRFGNRGATYERGLAYREYGREDFRDYGLADKRAVLEELSARRDYIDADRVGIYGSSSGGFMTLSALLVDNDFYKVGVAMSGPHDPQAYSNEWVERYAGVRLLEEGAGVMRWIPAAAAGNVELAERLQGNLLLIHGAQDDVVHPLHFFRVADALIIAGKRFDMFLVPGADHSLGSWQYLNGLIWDYFAAHLIGDPRDSADAIITP